MASTLLPPLTGLVAAPFTPFDRDFDLDLAKVQRLAELLAANGVEGAFVCGTTGEGYSLTTAERMRLATAWRAATPPGLKLAIHVGHASYRDSRALAAHAASIGADAVAAIAPSTLKPASVSALVEWCGEVAAAAPTVPFYYYHMPSITGLAFSATAFLGEADGRIPNLVGVKFTHEDLDDFQSATQTFGGRYSVLFGRDELLLEALQRGARGAVGSTYNYAAPVYHKLIAAFRAGDIRAAEQAQAQARAMIDVLNASGGLAAGKAIVKHLGVDCGGVRLPLRSLNEQQEKMLQESLAGLDFASFASRLGA